MEILKKIKDSERVHYGLGENVIFIFTTSINFDYFFEVDKPNHPFARYVNNESFELGNSMLGNHSIGVTINGVRELKRRGLKYEAK